jgi:uncharacterized protein YcfL
MKAKILIVLLALFLIGCGSSRQTPDRYDDQSTDKSSSDRQSHDEGPSRDAEWRE